MAIRICFALTLGVFAVVAAGAFAVVRTEADGVEYVHNDAAPRDGIDHLQLEELWRAGGEDDDVFFGLVPRVGTDPAGNVYVLDSQTCQVYVYTPEGELLRTLFREGEGPGEVRRPRDMALLSDGRVGLIQEFPGGISFVNADGTPAGRIDLTGPTGGIVNLSSCSGAGETLLFAGSHDSEGARPEIRNRLNILERYGPDGTATARYAEQSSVYDFGDFHFGERNHLPVFWFSFTLEADGTVYTSTERERYAITVHRPDGSLQRVIERDCEPMERTDQEYHRMKQILQSAFNGMSIQPQLEILRTAPVLAYFHRALQLHASGSLWVLPSEGLRPGPDGRMALFDVFDPSGEFVRQVALHAPHDGREVGVFLSGPDRILVVRGYIDSLAAQFGNGTPVAGEEQEPDLPEVICYRIVK